MNIPFSEFCARMAVCAGEGTNVSITWTSVLSEPSQDDLAVLRVVGALHKDRISFFQKEPCYGREHKFGNMGRDEKVTSARVFLSGIHGTSIFVETLI